METLLVIVSEGIGFKRSPGNLVQVGSLGNFDLLVPNSDGNTKGPQNDLFFQLQKSLENPKLE